MVEEQKDPLSDDKWARREAATLIAEQLGESEQEPRKTIERCVRILGIETALAYLKRTQEVEEAGGMMLPDNSRRRTPGGVYFYLIRKEVEMKQRMRIFSMPPSKKATPGTANTPQSATVALTWAERGPVLDETLTEKG